MTLAFGNVPISLRYEGTECNSIQAARIDHAARCRGSCCSRRGAIASTVFLVRTRISVPSAPDQGWTKADRHFVFRAARAAPCGATGRAPSCVARWRRSCTTHKTRKGRGGYPRGLSRVTSRRVNDGASNSIEPQVRMGCKRPARAARGVFLPQAPWREWRPRDCGNKKAGRSARDPAAKCEVGNAMLGAAAPVLVLVLVLVMPPCRRVATQGRLCAGFSSGRRASQ